MWVESRKLAAKLSEVGFHSIVFNTFKTVLKVLKGISFILLLLSSLQVVVNASVFRTLHFYTTIKKIMKLSCLLLV